MDSLTFIQVTVVAGILSFLLGGCFVELFTRKARFTRATGILDLKVIGIEPFTVADIVKAFIAVIATLAYLGMLGTCLFYAFIPFYQETFDTLLKWSIVPGLIWGAYFAQVPR